MIGSHTPENQPESIGLTMNFKRFAAEKRFYDESKDNPKFQQKNPAKGDTDNLSIQSAPGDAAGARMLPPLGGVPARRAGACRMGGDGDTFSPPHASFLAARS